MPSPALTIKIILGLLNLGCLFAIVGSWTWVIYRLLTRQDILRQGPALNVPWGGKTVLAIVMTYIGLQFVVPALYIGGLHAVVPLEYVRKLTFLSAPLKRGLNAAQQILMTIMLSMTFLAISAGILVQWSRAKLANFGLDGWRFPTDVFQGMLAWPILAPIVYGISFLATRIWTNPDKHPIQTWADDNPSTSSWATIFLAAVVVAPITEEFLFRGVLLGWLNRLARFRSKPESEGFLDQDGGMAPTNSDNAVGIRLFLANLVVSFVFAAMHAQVWPTPIPLFLLALSMGYLYQRTGSLIAPIALHMTFNAISTALLYLVTLAGGVDALKQELKVAPPVVPKAANKVVDRSINQQRTYLSRLDLDNFTISMDTIWL